MRKRQKKNLKERKEKGKLEKIVVAIEPREVMSENNREIRRDVERKVEPEKEGGRSMLLFRICGMEVRLVFKIYIESLVVIKFAACNPSVVFGSVS